MIDSNFERLWMYVDATNIDHLYSHTNHHRSMSNQTPHIHFFLFIQWTQPSGAATFTSYTFCHEVISHHLHYLVANLGWPASGAICINYNFLFLFSNPMFHSSQMDGYKSQNQKSEKILGKCLLRKMSFWCGFDCRLLSGILPRSVAPHSWTHSDTMLEDGMDHGYMEAADTWTQGFVTNIYIWLCVYRHWICSRNKDGIKEHEGWVNKEARKKRTAPKVQEKINQ